MSAELRVGTLHWRSSRGRRQDAEAALRSLDLGMGFDDRRVLVVRRLSASTTDPHAAREQLAALRRRAAHPASGPVDPHAEAVEFADEAEALLCLTRDIVSGVAGHRWWWAGRLPQHTTTTGETLTTVWLAEARWVPAVVAELVATDRPRAVTVLGCLTPAQTQRILHAVLAEHAPAALATASGGSASPGRRTPPSWTVDLPALPTLEHGAERALLLACVVVSREPSRVTDHRFVAQLLQLSALPPSALLPVSTDRAPVRPGVPPVLEAAALEGPPADQEPQPEGEVTPLRRASAPRPKPPAAAQGGRSWEHRPWAGGGPSLHSEMATGLYAVNLVRWFWRPELERASTGWAAVEAVLRWLLRGVPTDRRRMFLKDPLLPLLAELDGRPPGVRCPVRLGSTTAPLRRFLDEHEVPLSTFLHPGRLVVSRTHVDLVVPLGGVDLAARASGLDQDPGWVPELGRVVLFHFEEDT